MADAKKLCFKAAGEDAGSLCFKAAGTYAGHLVYKFGTGAETIITFAWGDKAKDLDICAYWLGAPNLKVGFGWNHHAAGTYHVYSDTVSGITYNIGYWGDVRDTNSSEKLQVWKSPIWSSGDNTLRIHLNFYAWDATNYPDTNCAVIASQPGGLTLECAAQTNPRSGKAFTTDPYVDVVFSSAGNLQSLTFHAS